MDAYSLLRCLGGKDGATIRYAVSEDLGLAARLLVGRLGLGAFDLGRRLSS